MDYLDRLCAKSPRHSEQVILQRDQAELIDLSNPDQVVVVEKYNDVPEIYSLTLHGGCLIG